MSDSKNLHRFFEVEIGNEDHGGHRPSTLGSALDSLQQAPDDVLSDWSGGESRKTLKSSLSALIAEHGENTLLEEFNV